MPTDPDTLPPTVATYEAYTRAERVATVGSSGVTQIAYDPETGSAFVTWKGGRTYCYEGVAADEWDRFRTADSKGQFANKIKATYPCRGPLL